MDRDWIMGFALDVRHPDFILPWWLVSALKECAAEWIEEEGSVSPWVMREYLRYSMELLCPVEMAAWLHFKNNERGELHDDAVAGDGHTGFGAGHVGRFCD